VGRLLKGRETFIRGFKCLLMDVRKKLGKDFDQKFPPFEEVKNKK